MARSAAGKLLVIGLCVLVGLASIYAAIFVFRKPPAKHYSKVRVVLIFVPHETGPSPEFIIDDPERIDEIRQALGGLEHSRWTLWKAHLSASGVWAGQAKLVFSNERGDSAEVETDYDEWRRRRSADNPSDDYDWEVADPEGLRSLLRPPLDSRK